jgi:quinoprotein glucose dehydrogenase
VKQFGSQGAVDLMAELHVDFDHVTRIGNSSPPMVYRDTIIVPPALEEGLRAEFDAQHARLCDGVRRAHRQAEMGVPHRPEGGRKSARRVGKTRRTPTRATPAFGRRFRSIPELGRAYLPVETPTDDYYGGHRLGSDLFANSVVAVDLETGKRIWHYQITHHDIWNLRSAVGARSGQHDGQRPHR